MLRALKQLGGGALDLLALPKVTITTSGGAAIDSLETYVTGTIAVSGAAGIAERTAQFRGRGNTTWPQPKKPYRIKLAAAASLVPGVAADRDWVLLASYFDQTLARTLIATDIGLRLPGMTWVPRFQPVEVTLNGVYIGVYHLGEHVKIAPARIPITAMGSGDVTAPVVTGGYSLEIDERGVQFAGDPGFVTSHNVSVAYDDPDGEVAAQATYIEDHITAFEAALYGGSWTDPEDGYAPFIDRDSFIDWYLVNELTVNPDSNFYSSCKIYKPRDDAGVAPLVMGPMWDFDVSMGNVVPGTLDVAPSATEFRTRGAPWFARLFDDPAFAEAAETRWVALSASLTDSGPSGIDATIDRILDRITPGLQRDQARWGYAKSRAVAVAELKTWLADRIAWMDDEMATA